MARCVIEHDSYNTLPHGKYRTSRFLSLRKRYRGYFEIIALMLEAAKDEEASRFSLMTRTNINSSQLKKYLPALTEIGFIDASIREGHILYRTNNRGIDFLRQYYVLFEMLLSGRTRDLPAIRTYQDQNDRIGSHKSLRSQIMART